MTVEEAKKALQMFQKHCTAIMEIVEPAIRNRQSLTGKNFYASRFETALIEFIKAENSLAPILASVHFSASEEDNFHRSSSMLKSTNATLQSRKDGYQRLRILCETVLLPRIESMTANPVPATEQVLPLSVVQNTRGYVEIPIIQANGCYEHQWYDACSVMIRRFVETLIIEVYEKHKVESDIKNTQGDYLMLSDLIRIALASSHFNFSRETKAALPLIKQMGDRSAHNRHYIATKSDVDKIIPGLRVAADDLLHLAGLK